MISFTRFFFLSRFQYIEFHIFTLCLQVFYERTIPFKPVYFLKISGFFSIYVRTCVHNCNVVVRFSIFPCSQNNCHMLALHIISASSSGVFKELTIRFCCCCFLFLFCCSPGFFIFGTNWRQNLGEIGSTKLSSTLVLKSVYYTLLSKFLNKRQAGSYIIK